MLLTVFYADMCRIFLHVLIVTSTSTWKRKQYMEFHKTVWAPPFPHFIGRTLDYCRVIISYNKLHHLYCLDVLLKCHRRPTGFIFFTVRIWYSTIMNFYEVYFLIIIRAYTRRNGTIQQPQIPTQYYLF